MNVLLGSSSLNVPFGFPSGSIADIMDESGQVTNTSASRASELVAIYWDGIDEKKIKALSSDRANSNNVLAYLTANGAASKQEAAAFMVALTSPRIDRQWIYPSWGIFKTVVQDATGTGAQGSGGSKSGFAIPSIGKIALAIGALIVVYGVATTGTKALISRRK